MHRNDDGASLVRARKDSVFLALLTMRERGGWHPSPTVSFLLATAAPKDDREIRVLPVEDLVPHDCARNLAAREFLKSDCDWLLMLDKDCGPHPSLFQMLDGADDHMDILVPRFFSFAENGRKLAWKFLPGDDGAGGDQWVEVEAAAGLRGFDEAFLPLHLRRRWADDPWEDIAFCHKARASGFRVWGNRSHEVDHFRTISLSTLARVLDPDFFRAANKND